MTEVDSVLAFWFRPAHRAKWFDSDPAFDGAVAAELTTPFEQARCNGLASWRNTPEGCLALCILLDQVPRNLFRGSGKAFACDEQARAVTRHALAQGFDRTLIQTQRLFLYLPLEHSESLADQDESCQLMADLDEDRGWYDYAVLHRAIIARFGRFPHRNAAMGRTTTPEEAQFLTEPGSAF